MSFLTAPKIDSKKLLSSAQCERVLRSVLGLRDLWIERKALKYSYYTLFGASYLDAGRSRTSQVRYLDQARKFNPILTRKFGWLYEIAFERLEERLGAPVRYHPRFARPGFHLYLEKDGDFGLDGTVHFDTQFLNLDWSSLRGHSLNEVLSFTLPVILPSSGSGMECWDVDYAEYVSRGIPLDRLVRGRRRRDFRYTPGKMLVTQGLIAHRILDVVRFKPGDMRLTLQGHAVRDSKGWVAYW